MASPKISIILPVRNEARCIGRLLDQLIEQTYPADAYEILVADGGSTDGTRDVVREKARQSAVSIRIVDNPGVRSGAGRNAGVAEATGEIILFIDGHCEVPSRRLLEDTVLLMEETGADCLCRPQPLIAFSPQGLGRIIADARASTLGHGRDSLIYDMTYTGFVHPASSGATYRRAVFEKVGAYDETFDACEDVDFNTRVAAAGYKAYTDPRVAVYYEPTTKFPRTFPADDALWHRTRAPGPQTSCIYIPVAMGTRGFAGGCGRRRSLLRGCDGYGKLAGGHSGRSRSHVPADYPRRLDRSWPAAQLETCSPGAGGLLRGLCRSRRRYVGGVARHHSAARPLLGAQGFERTGTEHRGSGSPGTSGHRGFQPGTEKVNRSPAGGEFLFAAADGHFVHGGAYSNSRDA